MNDLCKFKGGCTRKAVCKGLCGSHYKQKLRGRKLAPLRVEPGVRLPGLTVSQRAGTYLRGINRNLYVAAQTVIERAAEGTTP